MRISEALLKPGYFGDHAPFKAAVATSGIALQFSLSKLCASAQGVCSAVDGVNDLVKILLAMMVLDMVSGVLASRSDGQRITSDRLGFGMRRKITVLVVVAAAALLDATFKAHGLNTGGLLYQWTASWFIAVEGLSLYENASRLGLPMPTFLKQALDFLLEKSDKTAKAAVAALDETLPTEGVPPTPDAPK